MVLVLRMDKRWTAKEGNSGANEAQKVDTILGLDVAVPNFSRLRQSADLET